MDGRIPHKESLTVEFKSEMQARAVLERLAEAGLVEAHGIKRGRTYTLSAGVYHGLGKSAGYVRQTGFDQIQQEQMILRYAEKNGKITRKDAVALCRISEDQASWILRKICKNGLLTMHGKGRGTYYAVP